jgi:formylglycine-generating enzyme required for sulfatase activity
MKPPGPVRYCRYCGSEFHPGDFRCPSCWEPVGWRWFARILRRGILWGLLVCALLAGSVWFRSSHSAPAAPSADQKNIAAALDPLHSPPQTSTATLASSTAPASGGAFAPTEAGMVEIKAGPFVMGSFATSPDERPAHEVTLGTYAIGAREVTVEEYLSYCKDNQQALPEQPAGSGPKHPVAFVTWQEAKAYCEHQGMRLPTEAEWEKAARCGLAGGALGASDPEGLGRFAWIKENSQGRAHAVGTKAPSPCSLYDLLGNAAEWVADWYAPDYYKSSPAQDPAGPDQGDDKVVRGGSFNSPGAGLSASARDRSSPESGRADVGFRCVKGR